MSKKSLLTLTAFLATVNILSVVFLPAITTRIIRIVTLIVFFLLMLKSQVKRGNIIKYSFFFLIIADLMAFNYEDLLFNKLTSVIKIIAYMLLFKIAIPKFDFKKSNKFILIFFAILAILNLHALNEVLHFIGNIETHHVLKYLIYVHAITLVLLCYLVGNLNFSYPSKTNIYLSMFVFGIAFSDLSAVLAYYFDMISFSVLHRFLYVFSIFYAIRYMVAKEVSLSEAYL